LRLVNHQADSVERDDLADQVSYRFKNRVLGEILHKSLADLRQHLITPLGVSKPASWNFGSHAAV
jgi:hypothetical protein